MLGEFNEDLQVLGLHVESSQFRVLTEVHRRGCPSLSGALVLAEEEGYGRDSGRTMFQCFTDGFAQLCGPVGEALEHGTPRVSSVALPCSSASRMASRNSAGP